MFSAISVPDNGDYGLVFGTPVAINHNTSVISYPAKDTSVCTGPVVLTSSAANTYLWSTGATGQSLSTDTAGAY